MLAKAIQLVQRAKTMLSRHKPEPPAAAKKQPYAKEKPLAEKAETRTQTAQDAKEVMEKNPGIQKELKDSVAAVKGETVDARQHPTPDVTPNSGNEGTYVPYRGREIAAPDREPDF